MKKFVFSILLLILLGGAAFLFGYLPLWIGAGEYAVILTKTNGWNHPVVAPGEFVWSWQALFPTNLKLFPFTLERRQVRLDIQEELPSGVLYAAYSEGGADFSYRVSVDLNYRLRPEPLPEEFSALYDEEDEIDSEGLLRDAYAETEMRIERILKDTAATLIESGDFGLTSDAFRQRLSRTIEDEMPEIEAVELMIDEYQFPDLDLYRRAKENYLAFADRSHEITMGTISEAASTRAAETSRIEILKEYGRLLEEYPILMEYFSKSEGGLNLIPLPEDP